MLLALISVGRRSCRIRSRLSVSVDPAGPNARNPAVDSQRSHAGFGWFDGQESALHDSLPALPRCL